MNTLLKVCKDVLYIEHMLNEEKELLQKAKEGDRNAFGQLYDHYVKRIYNFIYYKTFKKDVAEDITSQTFYKALKNIHTLDTGKSFSAWLYTIANNSIIDHYRRDKTNADIDDFWDLQDESDIVGDVSNKQAFSEVKKYMKNLNQNERDIILMRVWQDLSYKEISEITGKSEASSKMAYSRAIQKIREALPHLGVSIILLTLKI
jgi:RNA polymerase sigma-70 factor (ECF subfamily)